MKKAFTLIEILVVISIVSILFIVGYANFRDYARRQALVGITKQLQADLRFTQAQAIEGKRPAGCTAGRPLNGYGFNIISPTSYQVFADCSVTPLVVKTVVLASDFTVSTPEVNPIIFKALAHGTNIPINQSVTIRVTQTSTTKTSDVTITDGGYISVDLPYTTNAPIPTRSPSPTPVGAPSPTPGPTPTFPPTPTPSPTSSACANKVCYQDLDSDFFLGASKSVCRYNNDCAQIPVGDPNPSYKKNLSDGLGGECNIAAGSDNHASNVNLCCWTTTGGCDGSCNYTNYSGPTNHQDASCTGPSSCSANQISCLSFSGSGCAAGTGNCYKRGSYTGTFYNNCSYTGGCHLVNSDSCYKSKTTCSWSW